MTNPAMHNPIREKLVEWLAENLPLEREQVSELLQTPPSDEMGDYAFPCFDLASQMRKAPAAIASDISQKFRPSEDLTGAEAVGPYVNFSVNRQAMTAHLLRAIHSLGEGYGHSDVGGGGTVVLDYSSPNIAKHLGVHHLRSALIGRALYNIYGALGYRCVGINHLGDWGTSFGMLIVACERWARPGGQGLTVSDLQDLYVRFNREAQAHPQLEEQARQAFRRLETGDPRATQMWEGFKEVSMREFEKVYRMLGIRFDSYTPESFFNDRMGPTLERLRASGLARLSDDALIVPLDDYGMPPLMLQKSDESSVYATREICAAEYRWEQYRFEKALYVVGSEQKLHFRQVTKVLELMGYEWADRIEHVDFGLLKFKDAQTGRARKGSTRTGDMISLEDVLNEGIGRAEQKVRQNLDRFEAETDVQQLAATIGIGAVAFSDLCVRRSRDVIFDWDRMLDFEGATGPYVQYAHARLSSILRKAGQDVTPEVDFSALSLPEEWALVRKLETLPGTVMRAAQENEPSLIATYLLDLCAEFSAYYSAGMREKDRRVLCDDGAVRAARLLLVDAVRHAVSNGLALLGIAEPERM